MIRRSTVGLTILLLLWWPACWLQAPCLAAPVEASLSVIFTPPAGSPPEVSITSPGSLFDVSEHTWRSRHAVAPPGTYVRLRQEGGEIAGAWADAKGYVDFAVLQASPTPCSLLYCAKQSVDISRGSIHAISGQETQSQPAATRNSLRLTLAYEGGAGQGELKHWNVDSGAYSGTYRWTSIGPVVRPWALLKTNSTTGYIFYDSRTFSGFRLWIRSTETGTERIEDSIRPVPHYPTAVAGSDIMELYYAWPSSQSTRIARSTRFLDDGHGIGTSLSYICGPPNLSNLVSTASPGTGTWLVGEEDGRVYLYRRYHFTASVKGVGPALATVDVSGQSRLLFAYMEPRESESVVWGQLYDGMGTLTGEPAVLFTIHEGTVPRISLAQSPAGDAWLFWQGSCFGKNQIFVTKVALPW